MLTPSLPPSILRWRPERSRSPSGILRMSRSPRRDFAGRDGRRRRAGWKWADFGDVGNLLFHGPRGRRAALAARGQWRAPCPDAGAVGFGPICAQNHATFWSFGNAAGLQLRPPRRQWLVLLPLPLGDIGTIWRLPMCCPPGWASTPQLWLQRLPHGPRRPGPASAHAGRPGFLDFPLGLRGSGGLLPCCREPAGSLLKQRAGPGEERGSRPGTAQCLTVLMLPFQKWPAACGTNVIVDVEKSPSGAETSWGAS